MAELLRQRTSICFRNPTIRSATAVPAYIQQVVQDLTILIAHGSVPSRLVNPQVTPPPQLTPGARWDPNPPKWDSKIAPIISGSPTRLTTYVATGALSFFLIKKTPNFIIFSEFQPDSFFFAMNLMFFFRNFAKFKFVRFLQNLLNSAETCEKH